MKFKKLLISASAIAAGSGLLATVLTSCAKSNIDKDLKIKLDDQGRFLDPDTLTIGTKSFNEAAQNALKLSSTWKTFKETLAKEIIYKWYENRAASNKHPNRNGDFKTFISKKKYKIDDEYNQKVDSYKSKYGANHQFYLQNEVLSPNGGTVSAYKHSQLIDAIKDEFLSNVFHYNYFSMAATNNDIDPTKYPHIFTETIDPAGLTTDTINDPANWNKFGFYAKSNKSFITKASDGVDALAKRPDGDYAIIQNYVFNRWFETEKPFFSAAALFKYNKPATVGTAMTDLYSNKTKVPDAPNEAFPFFGTASSEPEPSNASGYTGQRAFWKWFDSLDSGKFAEQGIYGDEHFNQTVSIPLECSEDGQTLLLCYAKDMIAGSSNTLYTPYAVSAATLYNQMLSNAAYTPINQLTKEWLVANGVLGISEPLPDAEDPIILKMFFYNTLPDNIGSSLDLTKIYPTSSATEYHCPLFKENKDFTFFYGDTSAATPAARSGIKYITNNVQVNNLVPTTKISTEDKGQPWIFELNETGMHAQTIDGYNYVHDSLGSGTALTQYRNGRKALKQILMFRLYQKQLGWDEGITSAKVLDTDGDLATYFKNNFADIILEMAFSQNKELNIFRDIETYEGITDIPENKQFFIQICNEQKLSDHWINVRNYIQATQEADLVKSVYDNVVSSDSKIYAYRSAQVTNSKNDLGSNKVYENGLLAPMVVNYDADRETALIDYGTTKHYTHTISMLVHPFYFTVEGTQAEIDTPTCGAGLNYTLANVQSAFNAINNDMPFIASIGSVKANKEAGFSAQIKAAKQKESNRFWFKSWIVDKTLYSFMDSNALANEIKSTTYQTYMDLYSQEIPVIQTRAANAISSVYKAKKILTSENNFSNFAVKGTTLASNFYSAINGAYARWSANNALSSGTFNDNALNEVLFDATMVYLAKNNFEKFYSALEDSIKDGERAYVAYLTKYNTYQPFAEISDDPSTLTKNPYKWDANVANIYDDWHYAGGTTTATPSPLKGDFDSYWNVIDKKFNGQTNSTTLGGFLGIQTPSKNELDSDSGLNAAAFGTGSRPFSHSVYQTVTVDTGITQPENAGVWYPWAGQGVDNEYDFTVTAKGAERQTPLTDDMFDAINMPEAKKLAYKFAVLSNTEDIRSLAGKIGKELHAQDNPFTRIASGQEGDYPDPKEAPSQMKYDIIKHLMDSTQETTPTLLYKSAFQRLENVELRKGMYGDFCFEKTPNIGFKLMITQINLADVHEKHMALELKDGNWVMPEESPITEDEFWYILSSFANESKYQQDAMKDAIKEVFKGKKLVVHDAQLYNKFDATWIKDWVKKPLGE